MAQERIEIDHLQGQVEVAREKADRDKDALKKAARWVHSSPGRAEDVPRCVHS